MVHGGWTCQFNLRMQPMKKMKKISMQTSPKMKRVSVKLIVIAAHALQVNKY
jgi:hypothetical protein